MITCSSRTIPLWMLHSVTSVSHRIFPLASDQLLTDVYELRLSRRHVALCNFVHWASRTLTAFQSGISYGEMTGGKSSHD